ncbi:hypothetical protein FA15DRAFT_674482 [Coprinopsis marcescibilis]|uniref:Peptidase C14 caspase domain-containing protein n=1 Tax=Coprinopsis marcescibilis TaxID=230819 RepID=A0A5C3KU29_COPMA|nr:hypothetical protein FA15DRAFT_674482 [Coprinopsis marcescibilis]
MDSRASRRFFALVIGINEYLDPETPNLRGAVNDADRIVKFLKERLLVPTSNIENLRNSTATRNAIKTALSRLVIDTRIETNDPILIYFSGHGGSVPAPAGWKDWDSTVQTLVPHDYGQPDRFPGQTIQGIPDRTLGTILKRIADAKGNNITVILDCCHSGSGTRSDDVLVRNAPIVGSPMPSNIDEDILPSVRGASVLPKFRYRGLESHVLLAACTPDELAHESKGQGAFTAALLQALGKLNLATDAVTYAELIHRLDISLLKQQNPQCEGNGDRMLFNNDVRAMKSYHHGHIDPTGKLTVDAGNLHGICAGSEFDIWAGYDRITQKPVATVKVDSVTAFKSHAQTIFKRNALGTDHVIVRAKHTNKPAIKIFVPQDLVGQLGDIFEANSFEQPWVTSLEANENLADVGISKCEGGFSVRVLRQEEQTYTSLPKFAEDKTGLQSTVGHIAFYYHHLRHGDGIQPTITSDFKTSKTFISQFNVEMYKLDNDDRPIGNNLITPEGVNLWVGPTLGAYGFKITNNSKMDVYPHLFYFNSHEFAISSFYKPVNIANPNQKPDPPLKSERPVLVGYGSDGAQPQTFNLDNAVDVENGFLKLYIATAYTDLSFIDQKPLGVATRGGVQLKRRTRVQELWGSFSIPFVLHRRETICLMGTTESKAPFLNALFSECTADKQPTLTELNSSVSIHDLTTKDDRSVSIVELSAFEDEDLENNTDICEDIVSAFSDPDESNLPYLPCRGLVFCYDISRLWNRIRRQDLLNFKLLRDICGDSAMKNVTIVTTNWDHGYNESFVKREEQLRATEHLCKSLIDMGAKFLRHGSSDSLQASSLLAQIATKPSTLFRIQTEACGEDGDRRSFCDTSIGSTMCGRVNQQVLEVEGNLKSVCQELEDAADDGEIEDLENDKEELEREVQKLHLLLKSTGYGTS